MPSTENPRPYDVENKPWDRITHDDDRRDESANAYRAFLDFCSMGPGRTIRELLEEYREKAASNRQNAEKGREPIHDPPPTRRKATMYGWSSRWNWQERARAWQEAQDYDRAVNRYEERQKMLDRHLNMSNLMLTKIYEAIQSIQGRSLSAGEARRWFETVVKQQRLALGMASDSTDVNIAPQQPSQKADGVDKDFRYDDPEEMAKVLQLMQQEAPGTFTEDDEDGA